MSELDALTLSAQQFEDATSTVTRLRLFIAFHPDPARIGLQATLQVTEAPWIVGRHFPVFNPVGDPELGAGLLDRYISRQALQMRPRDGALQLQPIAGASEVAVDGRLLSQPTTLSHAQLRAGVVLGFAHRVVLFLREFDEPATSETSAGAIDKLLLGVGPVMQQLRCTVSQIATASQDVLLTGETGSGKEVVARAIHAAGADALSPFVAVNMAAIPETLAAAELFGHTAGAYSGAREARAGYFRQAAGGTLFLDEVGDTPPNVQPQLLRALQEREVQVVGGAIESVTLRVIAATDLDVSDSGSFRSALRYRLAGLQLRVPPLREHLEDLPTLFLAFLRAEADSLPRSLFEGDDRDIAAWYAVMSALMMYRWPGNVRELQAAAIQLALPTSQLPQVPDWLRAEVSPEDAPGISEPGPPASSFSDEYLLGVLRESQWEVTSAARRLGLSRGVLGRRLEGVPGFVRAADLDDLTLRSTLVANDGRLGPSARALNVSREALRIRLRQMSIDWRS